MTHHDTPTITITRAQLAATLRDPCGPGLPDADISRVWAGLLRQQASRARQSSKPRQPWMDELSRLRWVETELAKLLDGWRESSAGLRAAYLDGEPRADELDAATAAVQQVLHRSHAATAPGSSTWAQWHLDQLTWHLHVTQAELRAALADAGVDAQPAEATVTALSKPRQAGGRG